jgi:TonB family protein
MITLALQSTLMLGLAFAVAAMIHRRAASMHRLLWITAFAGLAVLPILARIPSVVTIDAPAVVGPIVVNVTEAAAAPRDWVFLIWAAGCAMFIVRIVAGLTVIAWRTAQAEASPYRIAGARVLFSRHIDSPFTWGIWRHTVLLPAVAAQWCEEKLRSTLVHETVHVARHDALWRLISQIVCAFYWPIPLAWVAVARLHAAMEQSCDDAVLETGIGAREYAGHLLDVSRTASLGEVAAGTVAMAGAAQLEARLRSILDGTRKRAPLSRMASVVSALAAFAVLVPIGITRLTAQNTGSASLSGVVSDMSGGRVPGALVMATEGKSKKTEAMHAREDGSYAFQSIPAGEYILQVWHPGFAPYTSTASYKLANGDAATADATLAVGKLQETIQVTGERVAPKPVVVSQAGPSRLRIGGNIRPARIVNMVKPVYPDTAKARNAEGLVLLRASLMTDGSVGALDVINTTADPELASAAKDAVRQWRYETTLLNGQPIEVVNEITINFSLGK